MTEKKKTEESRALEEMDCGTNIAYLLKDNSQFLTTEYKVLQSQTGGCFLRSMKMFYNGRIQLYYITNGYKTFLSMSPVISGDRFPLVVGNLLDAVEEVRNNGFLSVCRLDIRFDRIYLEPSTYKIRLVYLPIEHSLHGDSQIFESRLRSDLIHLIDGRADKTLPELMKLISDLADASLSLNDICVRLRGGIVSRQMSEEGAVSRKQEKISMYIIAMNAPVRIELKINKSPYVIGKKVSEVDGAVTFSRMISRRHCMVSQNGNEFTVTDLRSANGTFLNRERLMPERPYTVRNGDIVRMANTDFQVIIR